MLKIISWNVNSVRTRLDHIKKLIAEQDIDFLLLQEIKCQKSDFPIDEFNSLGYDCIIAGQKSYNGVAIIYRKKFIINDIVDLLPFDNTLNLPEQQRFISINVSINNTNLNIVNVYIPNGNPIFNSDIKTNSAIGFFDSVDNDNQFNYSDKYIYKLQWQKLLLNYIHSLNFSNSGVIVCGDFNIAPTFLDSHKKWISKNNALLTDENRAFFRSLCSQKLHDLELTLKHSRSFTWWDYRAGSFSRNEGMRIDFFLVSSLLLDKCLDFLVLSDYRDLDRPSDHAPILSCFDI